MNKQSKIIIGVTGTGSLIGQAIIKSIKASTYRNNCVIIGMDYFLNTVGSYWCDKNYVLPDILKVESKTKWEQYVIETIKTNNIQILFIGVDFELIPFAKLKLKINKHTGCHVVVNEQSIVKIADDKYLTYQFLKNNNLFFPKSYLPNDFHEAIHEKIIDYPVVLKPRVGYRSRNVFIINSSQDFQKMIAKVNDPIIQEYIGTPDSEYTCGVICVNDIQENIVLKRYLNEGNTTTAFYKKDFPSIISKYIMHASKKLGVEGVCNFQLRIDKQGIPKIFEINARHSGTTYMRALLGFNEIEVLIDYLLFGRRKQINIKEGCVKRYFEEMIVKL